MAAVMMESVSKAHLERPDELASEVSDLLRSRSVMEAAAVPVDDATSAAAGRVNNSLQALMNLFYLIAREARLEPQLQPLVTQVQAELAQLSRSIQRLDRHEARTSRQNKQ